MNKNEELVENKKLEVKAESEKNNKNLLEIEELIKKIDENEQDKNKKETVYYSPRKPTINKIKNLKKEEYLRFVFKVCENATSYFFSRERYEFNRSDFFLYDFLKKKENLNIHPDSKKQVFEAFEELFDNIKKEKYGEMDYIKFLEIFFGDIIRKKKNRLLYLTQCPEGKFWFYEDIEELRKYFCKIVDFALLIVKKEIGFYENEKELIKEMISKFYDVFLLNEGNVLKKGYLKKLNIENMCIKEKKDKDIVNMVKAKYIQKYKIEHPDIFEFEYISKMIEKESDINFDYGQIVSNLLSLKFIFEEIEEKVIAKIIEKEKEKIEKCKGRKEYAFSSMLLKSKNILEKIKEIL